MNKVAHFARLWVICFVQGIKWHLSTVRLTLGQSRLEITSFFGSCEKADCKTIVPFRLCLDCCRVTVTHMRTVTMDIQVILTVMGRERRRLAEWDSRSCPLFMDSLARMQKKRWTSVYSQRNGHTWMTAAAGTSWRHHSKTLDSIIFSLRIFCFSFNLKPYAVMRMNTEYMQETHTHTHIFLHQLFGSVVRSSAVNCNYEILISGLGLTNIVKYLKAQIKSQPLHSS